MTNTTSIVNSLVERALAEGMSPAELRARVVMATLTDDDRCQFCGAIATRLCDHVIGIEITGEAEYFAQPGMGPKRTHPTVSIESEFYTCDLRLCGGCSKFAGLMIHVPNSKTPPDHRDHCPIHAASRREADPVTPQGLAVQRGLIELQLRHWHEARNACEVLQIGGGK